MERGYNARGYLETLADATTGTRRTLVTYGAMDARGNIETETFGNGARTTRAHDPKTGRPRAIGTSRGTSTLQSHAYAWLTDGSLASRTANAAGGGATARTLRKEEFDYDYLGRLDSAATKLGGSTTSTMYEQRSAGPHALTRATVGGVVHNFHYDALGHLERDDAASGDDRFIEWDGRGLATKVTVATVKDAEKPAGAGDVPIRPGRGAVPEDERVEGGRRGRDGRHEVGDDLLRRRLREDDAGVHRWRGRIRDGVDGVGGAHARRPGAACETDAVRELEREPGGDRVSALRPPRLVGFDHGRDGGGAGRPRARPERRKPDWTRRLSEAEIAALGTDHGDRTSRGFTGHEHLDRTGLVHMNGRLYDPLLGRFLSPDPIVANPADGQQWNLYSYAGNSPLSYVDPSGLSFCDPAQQSWCGGGLPGMNGGWGGGGGYSTRTVTVSSVHVTFGRYYDSSLRWHSRWEAEWNVDGWVWTDYGFWEEIVSESLYPRYEVRSSTVQVVEQGAGANEPAGSHSPHSGSSPGNNGPLAKGQSRGLTPNEIARAKSIFKDEIDYSKVRIFRKKHNPGHPKNRAMAPRGNILFHPEDPGYADDFGDSKIPLAQQETFVHEMTHVWQHQQGENVLLRGMFERKYDYELEKGKSFEKYGIEQQGMIVQDYFRLKQKGAGPGKLKPYEDILPF